MWITRKTPTGPTLFYPQLPWELFNSFPQALWSKRKGQTVHRTTCYLSTASVDNFQGTPHPCRERRPRRSAGAKHLKNRTQLPPSAAGTPGTAFPTDGAYRQLLILAVISRMLSASCWLPPLRATSILRMECRTVEWSRENSWPMSGRLRLVS